MLSNCSVLGRLRLISTRSVSQWKSFDEIPTKIGLIPAYLSLILSGGPGYLHEHCQRRHKELGPIYKEHLGNIELVFLADSKLIQTAIKYEGQYPHHSVPEAWLFYNSIKNIERGLFFRTGESWLRMRKTFNKVFLSKSSDMSRFNEGIMKINDDLLNYWRRKFEDNDGTVIVEDLKMELCKWSIETTGYILFGSRLGCVPERHQSRSDPRAIELVENVTEMFNQTSKFQIFPVKLAHRIKLSIWRKFELASTKMIEIADEYAREYIERIKQEPESSCGLAKDLMDSNELTEKEITQSIVDLIIAASDTTSNALQWMLYSLAREKTARLAIREELDGLGTIDYEELKTKAQYLKAFMRETLRLYPTAPFLARTLERDIVLGGYNVPAGKPIVFSLHTTSRMAEYFDNPEAFQPERWLRPRMMKSRPKVSPVCIEEAQSRAYASLPFGLGARMCIGKRAAEMEMALFIASLVKRFNCSLVDETLDVGIKLKMVLCPKRPIRIRLNAR